MRRALRILAWLVIVLLGLPVLAVAGVFAALNLDPGRRLAERLVGQVTGGTVVLQGVSGRFPDHLRIARLEVRDRNGAWLWAEDAALDWHPTALLRKQALVDRLHVARGAMPRLPVPEQAPDAPAPDGGGSSFTLPVRVTARDVTLDRFELGQPVAGAAAALSLRGSADLPSLEAGDADVTLQRLDGEGRYALRGHVGRDAIRAQLDAAEPAGGLASQLAKLPDLGALRLTASVDGPRQALATKLDAAAGLLKADASGTIDLVNSAADLDVRASAPAMRPRADVSWQGVNVDARVRGPFTRPAATGTLRIQALEAAGAAVRLLSADLGGDAGQVSLRATAEGVRLPGPAPDLLGTEPLRLQADAKLDDPARPVTFALSHPLISADGRAETGGDLRVAANLALPQLAPFARIGGLDVQGGTKLAVRAGLAGGTTSAEVEGSVSITGGLAPLPALVGPDAQVGVSVQLAGQDILLRRLQVDGRTLRLAVDGGQRGGALDLNYKVGLSDLSVLAATLTGALDAQGRVQGRTDDVSATLEARGELGAPGVPRGPVRVSLQAKGLPGAPSGSVVAEGTLAGAPLVVRALAQRAADGALHARIERAEWRSAQAEGTLDLPPGGTLPLGRVALRVGRLDDFRPFVGQPLSGRVEAEADLGAQEVRIHLDARDAGIPGSHVGRAVLQARVAHPLERPAVEAQLQADGIAAGGIGGSARVEVSGPQERLAIRANAGLRGVAGADVQVATDAVLDAPGKEVRVASLQATWKGETARLLAPARVTFGNGVAVDRLRVGLRQAVLEVAGKLSPTLDIDASLRNATAELARIALPDLQADGVLNLEAKLRGTPARPDGTVRVQAAGVRVRTGPTRGLPPANLTATAQLAGGAARVDARLAAGNSAQLTVTGRVPLDPAGALDLRANGSVDLALLDPVLTAGGRRARGRVLLDLGAAGGVSAPRLAGSARLQDVEVQDFAQGARVDAINGTVEAAGQALRLVGVQGRAGPGTIAVSGTVGVLAPGLPVDLRVQMSNARPLASDRLSADLDADLALRGQAGSKLTASGTIGVRRADIAIPERLPVSVATLDVRRAGERRGPPAPAASGPDVDLDLTVDAPRGIFVRGRGIDSELGGKLTVRGSAARPQVGGGFEMRRGLISVAGTTLTFTRGKVGFDGTGPTGKIDPSLNFVAESGTSSVTARLQIGGYASKPVIALTSTPELPQDEVLAYLLFKRSAKELGPFQLAEIAAALAQLTGVGGGVGNPLEAVRKGLGLDRLSVGGSSDTGIAASAAGSSSRASSSSNSPTVEAGRYVANGVYVGAKQGTTGANTQATVQIDITRGLKVETDVGTGQGGNSVGLRYEFEW